MQPNIFLQGSLRFTNKVCVDGYKIALPEPPDPADRGWLAKDWDPRPIVVPKSQRMRSYNTAVGEVPPGGKVSLHKAAIGVAGGDSAPGTFPGGCLSG